MSCNLYWTVRITDGLQYITSRQHPRTPEHRAEAVNDARKELGKKQDQGDGVRIKSERYVKQHLRCNPAKKFYKAASDKHLRRLLAKNSWGYTY